MGGLKSSKLKDESEADAEKIVWNELIKRQANKMDGHYRESRYVDTKSKSGCGFLISSYTSLGSYGRRLLPHSKILVSSTHLGAKALAR